MIRLVALLMLLAAPVADAKELTRVSVCGADDCVRVTQKDLPGDTMHLLAEALGEADPPAAPAPWYRLEVRGRGDGEAFSWSQAYVPSDGLVRGLENASHPWSAIVPGARRILAKLTRELTPMPAATLEGLDVMPPEAQVDEVFAPAQRPAGEAATWPWLAVAGAAVLTLAIRRRRPPVPRV